MEHGTDVARVIIEPSTQIGSFKGIFRIAVARLNDPDPPYKISVDSVPTAVAYAGYIQADVVNLSVVIGSASEGLKNILSTSHALVVAAAGNGGARIEKLNIFPPGYADMHRMIVVGAHDWDGEITTFSNRGADILAPGCAVPVTTSSGSRRYVSGTSFAAPLVSQTAAQMVAVGIPNFPALLRSRLLASAKYEQRLEDVTRYAGVLNPERAIRAKEDSIWLRGATSPIFGTLDSAENWSCQALGESYRSTNLVKVETVGPEKQLRLWISGAEPGEFSRVMCSSGFDNPNLRFKSTEASEFETISWKDVQDVVPRLQAQ
jgi:subtilisin family serine protease